MRHFFLAFIVFLAWSVFAIWYFTSDATSAIASFFKAEEKEIGMQIDSLAIKKRQDSIADIKLAVFDSISREKNLEINTARLYAFNEKNEVLFIFDTIYLKFSTLFQEKKIWKLTPPVCMHLMKKMRCYLFLIPFI